MPDAEDFRQALKGYLAEATAHGRTAVDVNAGHLHRVLGGYPDPATHRMPICCSVMRAEMKLEMGDRVIVQPLKGSGPSLTIRYVLPRPK